LEVGLSGAERKVPHVEFGAHATYFFLVFCTAQ
jgi:hypothetical protein